jgi:Trk-type K+ transport system membrane component
MRWRFILNILGILLFFFGLTMIFPLLVGLYYREQSLISLSESMAVTVFAGLMLYFIFRKARAEVINQREGMAIVAVGWTAAGLFGALPFYLGDGYFTFTDAVFESVISFVQVLMLMLGDMSLHDALCHTYTTMPTGGFSPKNSSTAHYNSVYFDCVFIFFMLLAGINFSLHYQILRGKTLAFWQDSECRFFIGAVILITLVVSLDVFGSVYETIGETLRYGAFQVVSIVTTTGFATADYEKWPAMSQLILLLCMFLGASADSTGGGMKCLRIMLCY